jgi:hypothetical protein
MSLTLLRLQLTLNGSEANLENEMRLCVSVLNTLKIKGSMWVGKGKEGSKGSSHTQVQIAFKV